MRSAPMPNRFRLAVLGLALGSLIATTAHAGPREDAQADNASRVLAEIQAIPESAIPDKLLDEAEAIVIVPDTIKAGLVLGGRRGRGVLSVRTEDGGWSAPSFVTLTGGSIGLQVGVQSADIILVFRTRRGLDSIVNGKFTLGADAGVAAGPMGRNASTATDGQLKAEIWSWSRARGLFAGVALDGAVLRMDHDANEAAYGRDTTPRMIFENRVSPGDSVAIAGLRGRLNEATASARARRSDDDAAPTPAVPRDATPAAPAVPAPPTTTPQPQPFETVEPAVTTEPLPEDPPRTP